jgi:hypothetical protein
LREEIVGNVRRALLVLQGAVGPEHATVMSLALPQSRYPTGASQAALYRQVVEGLSRRPEVQAVGVGFPGPLRGSNASAHFFINEDGKSAFASRWAPSRVRSWCR